MNSMYICCRYSPVGIMFLIIGKVLSVEDMASTARQLVVYLTTITAGAIIHVLILLPLIYFVLTKKNPFRIFRGIPEAVVTALAIASRLISIYVRLI